MMPVLVRSKPVRHPTQFAAYNKITATEELMVYHE